MPGGAGAAVSLAAPHTLLPPSAAARRALQAYAELRAEKESRRPARPAPARHPEDAFEPIGEAAARVLRRIRITETPRPLTDAERRAWEDDAWR